MNGYQQSVYNRYAIEPLYHTTCRESAVLTNKDRLCEQSEPQSYPVVGQARRYSMLNMGSCGTTPKSVRSEPSHFPEVQLTI